MIKAKKKRGLGFAIALLAYALVFLTATAVGLNHLWDYMDAYERSRPHIALDSYMENLTAEYVADKCGDLIDSIDHNVQTEQQCREVICEALTGDFSCAKRSAESDEDTHIYAIRCGKQVIGSMTMTRSGETRQGFTAWEVAGDEFDLSYLVSEAISITVPQQFTVSALGNVLGSAYITEENIQYSLLTEFYDDFDLPTMVTYTAGPFLGEGTLEVTDADGSAIAIGSETDMNSFLNNCTVAETGAVDKAVGDFIQCYVDFTSCTGGDTMGNYNRLAKHMVSGGELAKRMYEAIVGLYWVTDRGATLTDLQIYNYVNLGDGRYLCDLTYIVDTTDFAGSVQATASVKLILLQTDSGLKVESMLSA